MPDEPQVIEERRDPNELEDERMRELLARVHSIERRNPFDEHAKLEDEDPKKIYEWINIHPSRVSTYQMREYEIVKSGTGGNSKVKSKHSRKDGTHVWGDAILMQVDRDLRMALDASAAYKALEQNRLSPGGYTEALARFARENKLTIAPISAE
jgi:hypothetical protein